jgi:transcriptional regulator with XRE-family HTH domain
MATKRKSALSFSDQLRRIIDDSELSRNQICLAAGIDPSHLHRFFHGRGAISNHVIDRLAPVLKLTVATEVK